MIRHTVAALAQLVSVPEGRRAVLQRARFSLAAVRGARRLLRHLSHSGDKRRHLQSTKHLLAAFHIGLMQIVYGKLFRAAESSWRQNL